MVFRRQFAGHTIQSLFVGFRYTKQDITTEQQIVSLQERGLFIDDVEQAIEVLETISYFRLAGYWRHLESDRSTCNSWYCWVRSCHRTRVPVYLYTCGSGGIPVAWNG